MTQRKNRMREKHDELLRYGRMITERTELTTRICLLAQFALSDTYRDMTEVDRKLVDNQMKAMEGYKTALQVRIDWIEKSKD